MALFVTVALLLAAAERPLYGYTDPGSGLLLWQMMGAALVGSLFYLKKLFGWLRLGRRKTGHENDH
jgi:hypothetical protein